MTCRLCQLERQEDVDLLQELQPFIDLDADEIDWAGFADHLDVDVTPTATEVHMEDHQLFALGDRSPWDGAWRDR